MATFKRFFARNWALVRTSHFLWLLLLLLLSESATAQTTKEDTAAVNGLLEKSKTLFGTDPVKAIAYSQQAHDMAARLKFEKGQAIALKNIGIGYYFQQKHEQALNYWHQSLAIFERMKDDVGISNLLNNISAVYKDKGDDVKALDYCLQALKLAEKTNDTTRIFSSLVTAASIYHNSNDPKALDYLLKALPLRQKAGNTGMSSILLSNLGEIYYDQQKDEKALPYFREAIAIDSATGQVAFAYNGIGKILLRKKAYDASLQYHRKALAVAEKVGDQFQQMRAWQGIGNVNLQQGQYTDAFDYLNKAKSIAEELGAKVDLRDIYQNLSLAYAKVADFQNAYLYKTRYADVKDTIYNTESLKKLGLLNLGFELSKKEDQIKLLTNEKKLGEVEVQKQRQAKTAFAIGLILLIAIAFIIFRGYRHTEKVNKVLDRQKLQIQTLLTNILPAEVVKELQENGRAKPRSYEKVSVLFSDFRNFTMIAEKMSPEELVKELNICFVAFDDIIERNKLEKIKTIGDAYMCAGGIPTADISHPFRIVRAAVEIQAYMKGFNQRRHELGLEPLEMRIGIHVGPVVAGVVGKKKYAYDIWGNTVNIASRMESNGEPGKINISAATYDMIKDKYICTHRGKLYAKNVGEIDMYFVQDEITVPAEAPLAKPAEPLDDVVYAN